MTAPAKAKKAPAKGKPSTKPSAPTLATPSTDGEADPVFLEWKAGVTIAALVKTHRLGRSEIRRRLIKGAGSRAAFHELRKAGAGGPMKGAATPTEDR